MKNATGRSVSARRCQARVPGTRAWHRTPAPTVVLSVGAGDFSTDWALVQPEVAKHTCVCSYDRSGEAWSDPLIAH